MKYRASPPLKQTRAVFSIEKSDRSIPDFWARIQGGNYETG